MSDYIKREDAISTVKHAWAKGLEPSQYIEIIPAADVVEVKHGKWKVRTVRGEAELYCSVCGNSPNVIYAYEFCPFCGAKMDLED